MQVDGLTHNMTEEDEEKVVIYNIQAIMVCGSGRRWRQRWTQELTTGHSHDPFCRANEVGILAYSFPVVIVY